MVISTQSIAHGSCKCVVRVLCGGSWGHQIIMPRPGGVQRCAYHDCNKRSDKKRSFGHASLVVPAVERQLPHLFKTKHDGVLSTQHGCRLTIISDGRVEGNADYTLLRKWSSTTRLLHLSRLPRHLHWYSSHLLLFSRPRNPRPSR